MSETETPTQTPTQGAEAGPPPATQEENPFLAASQEAAPTETPGPEAGAEEKPWWHSPESEDGLWDHEQFKNRRDQLESESADRGRLQAQQEMTPLIEDGTRQFEAMTQQLRTLYGRLNKAATEAGFDDTTVDNLLANYREAFSVMNKVADEQYQSQHRGQAYNFFLQAIAQDIGDFSLTGDFQNRLAYAARGMDSKFIPDLRKRIAAKEVKEAEEKFYKKGLKEGQGAKAELVATQQRKTGGPNLAPGSPAGGQSTKDDNEFLERWGLKLEGDDERAHRLLKARGIDIPTRIVKT